MDRRNILLLLVLGIVIIVLVSGCIRQKGGDVPGDDTGNADLNGATPSTTPAKVQQKINECLAEPADVNKDACLLQAAKTLRNSEPCTKTVVMSADECLLKFATQFSMDAECEKISSVSLEDDCYSAIGIKKSSAPVCEKIRDITKKNSCLSQIALRRNNVEVCKQISDSRTRYGCFATVGDKKNDLAICDLIPQDYIKDGKKLRDACYISTGQKVPAVCLVYEDYNDFAKCYNGIKHEDRVDALCDRLNGDEAKAECYSDVALNEEDYEACGQISDSTLRDSCYVRVIDEGIVTSEMCDELSGSDISGKCIIALASESKDYGICEKINKTTDRYDCYSVVAINNEDADKCALITGDIGKKNSCLAEIGILKKDAEICEQITTSQLYLKCYSEIAVAEETPELCSEVKVEKFQVEKYNTEDLCFKEYAVKAEDDSFCSSIQNDNLEATCEYDVSIALLCKKDDNTCPSGCSFPGDSDCNECKTNADCEDSYFSTSNVCSGAPGRCTSQIIVECSNNDFYCPSACDATNDSDCTKTTGVLKTLQFIGPGSDPAYPFTESNIKFLVKNDGILDLEEFYYKLSIIADGTEVFDESYLVSQQLASGQNIEISNSQFLSDFGQNACEQYSYSPSKQYEIGIALSTDDFKTDIAQGSQYAITFTGSCPA